MVAVGARRTTGAARRARRRDRRVYLVSHPVIFALLTASRGRTVTRLGGTVLVHGAEAFREALTRVPLDRTAQGTTGGTASAVIGAGVLFDQRADIVYVAAGKSGLGAINEVRSRPNAYVIGVDSNQDGLAPGKVLTSVLKRVDVAVYRVVQDDASGTQEKHVELDLRDAGVDLTDFKYTRGVIGDYNILRLRDLRGAIVAGKIVPPQTRAELATFKPVAF